MATTAAGAGTRLEHLDFIEPVQIGLSQGRRAGAYGGHAHRTYGVLGDVSTWPPA
ncbi:MAG: hypothetical protein R2854_15590 [Caldilineaceae bacterium]